MRGPSAKVINVGGGLPIATAIVVQQIVHGKRLNDRRRYAAERQMAKIIGADERKAAAEAKRARKNAKRVRGGVPFSSAGLIDAVIVEPSVR